MIYLAIECTFNDFCVAITDGYEVYEDIITTPMLDTWKQYGGVVPHLITKEVRKSLELSLKKIIYKLPRSIPKAICISSKNIGIISCLNEGMKFAEYIANYFNIPIIRVNHVYAHFFSNFINDKLAYKKLNNDFLYLITSGKTTKLFLWKNKNMNLVSETIDIALGDCLDKLARKLKLSNAIEMSKKAKFDPTIMRIPQKSIYFKNPIHKLNLSFSGLQTYIENFLDTKYINIKASSYPGVYYEILYFFFNNLIFHIKKILHHLNINMNIINLILGGGVTANLLMRQMFYQEFNCFFPDYLNSTDNGGMIGITGFLNL